MNQVTVLIPAHNESAGIAETVRSALEQTHRPAAVIVIDDSSTDDTGQVAELAGAHVIRTEHRNKGRNLNTALLLVDTDLTLCLDADTRLASDAIERMVATIDEGCDATCSAVLPKQKTGLFVRARRVLYTLDRHWMKPVQVAVNRLYVLSGCGSLYRTDAVRAVGGFADVVLSEDTHLTWRLQAAGFRVGFTRQAVSYTQEPETFQVYLKQILRWFSGNAQVIAEHWRQHSHPGRFLITITRLWDALSMTFFWPVLIWLALFHGAVWAGAFGAWSVALNAAAFGFVAWRMGVWEAAKCYPAYLVVGFLTRYVYVWCLIREWVLGRHFASWTGRQGRGTVITPMSRRRKAVFTLGLSLLFGATARHRRQRGRYRLAT